jgi:hypothetical protein
MQAPPTIYTSDMVASKGTMEFNLFSDEGNKSPPFPEWNTARFVVVSHTEKSYHYFQGALTVDSPLRVAM